MFGDSEDFTGGSAVAPYAGAGSNHMRCSTDISATSFPGLGFSGSSTGLNVVGGLGFRLGVLPAFAEVQYSTSSSDYVTLSAGVMFGG